MEDRSYSLGDVIFSIVCAVIAWKIVEPDNFWQVLLFIGLWVVLVKALSFIIGITFNFIRKNLF